MRLRVAYLALPASILVAAAIALIPKSSSAPTGSAPRTTAESADDQPLGAAANLVNGEVGEQATGELPPGHPPISEGMTGAATGAAMPPASDEAPSVRWTMPPSWHEVPSPSTMRLATYEIPKAPGDADVGQLSIVRAGGSPEANAQRWVAQFEDAGKDTHVEQNVHGMQVTVVRVEGTYLGGGMMNGASDAHPHWALLGAIVQSKGTPYFFKLVGPAASVNKARPAFDAMIAALTPA